MARLSGRRGTLYCGWGVHRPFVGIELDKYGGNNGGNWIVRVSLWPNTCGFHLAWYASK